MTITTGAPAAMTAGVSDEELKLMREATRRLAVQLAGSGPAASAPDVFDALTVPFFPLSLGGPGRWHREDGHH
jgi:hypothetical protein